MRWGAQPEATGVHASVRRTFDPEAADFFYVPVYGTCMIFPVHCYADGPWFHVPSGERRGGLGWGGRATGSAQPFACLRTMVALLGTALRCAIGRPLTPWSSFEHFT